MELEDLYSMLAKNILYEIKQRKENIIKRFLKNFSCKSTCAISEEDHFEIIIGHIKKLEQHKEQIQKIKAEKNISNHSIV